MARRTLVASRSFVAAWGGAWGTFGLAAVLAAPCVLAQRTPEPHFELVELAGLSHESVGSIAQDAQGFLWFGTWDGLDRWDGREVTSYTHDPEDPGSLSHPNVAALLVDRNGDLWALTLGGLDRFDPHSGSFEHYELPRTNDSGNDASSFVWSLHEAGDGTLWAGTTRGLFARPAGDENFVAVDRIAVGMHAEASGVVDFREDGNGDLWLLGSGWPRKRAALYKVERLGPRPADMRLDHYEIADGSVVSFLIDRQDRFWTGGTVAKQLDANSRRFVERTPTAADPNSGSDLEADQSPTSAFWQDRQGSVWIGTSSGLYMAGPGQDRAVRVPLGHHAGFVDAFVLWIFEDDSGAIWVSTIAGLYRHDPARKAFTTLGENLRDPERGLTSGRVASVAQDGTDLWLGSWGSGVDRVDGVSGRVRNYRPSSSQPGSLPEAVAHFLLLDSGGRLFVVAGRHLCEYERPGDTFSCSLIEGVGLDDQVWTLVEGPSGSLWLGTETSGLFVVDPDRRTFVRHADFETTGSIQAIAALDEKLIDEKLIDEKLIDQRPALRGDAVWTINLDGHLIRFDLDAHQKTRYVLANSRSDRLDFRSIYDLHFDRQGVLWIGSSSGLARFQPGSSEARHYLPADGLPGSYVYSILPDDSGNLWLSTNRGIARFDDRLPERSKFRVYDLADGVGSMEFNRRARFRAADGRFYFGGKRGVTSFHPDEISDNPYLPPLALAAVTIVDKSGNQNDIPGTSASLKLRPKDHSVTFEFAALSYTDPMSNQYRYWLDGFDHTWVEAGNRPVATYTSLPAGKYVFRVQGSNNDGVWNKTGLHLPITVVPPFWVTTWFRALAVALIACLLTLAYRWRVAQLIQLERLRIRIAGDLHDDLSSDLSGIALTMDLLERREVLDDADRRRIDQVRKTAIGMIDGVRDLVWYVDPGHDSVEALSRRMHSVADTLLADREVEISTEISKRQVAIDMAFRRHVYLAFKELLHNVAKHSKASQVSIRLEQAGGQLALSVRDDGVGFDTSAARTGFGITNLEHRAEQLGGLLDIKSEAGRGTAVTFQAPLDGHRRAATSENAS